MGNSQNVKPRDKEGPHRASFKMKAGKCLCSEHWCKKQVLCNLKLPSSIAREPSACCNHFSFLQSNIFIGWQCGQKQNLLCIKYIVLYNMHIIIYRNRRSKLRQSRMQHYNLKISGKDFVVAKNKKRNCCLLAVRF